MTGKNGKRRFKEVDQDEPNRTQTSKRVLRDRSSSVQQTTSNDNVELVVEDLVTELVNTTTDSELSESMISDKSITNLEFANAELDDSFKLSYDFNLNNDDALYSDAQFASSFGDSNPTTSEHNYANVPSTSSTRNQSSLDHSTLAVKPKGALKFRNDAIKSTSSKRNVKFKGVTVFYFSRNQGGTAVPSQGGSTLGMEMSHYEQKDFTLDAHQEEKRRVHREILLRQKRYERLYQKQQHARLSNLNQSDSDDDSLENISDISDSELDFDSWYFLQPVPVRQRRALLRESGITKIDSSEKDECKEIRLSREYCGCECRVYCDPETCQCSLNGIKCQVDRLGTVDRLNFPCGCSRDSCNNIQGRQEFNPLRVRTHFVHTIMRLELEKKNDQQFNDETLNSNTIHPNHQLKQSSTSNIELNQTPLFNPSSLLTTHHQPQQQQQLDQIQQPPYELKQFTPSSTVSSNPKDIYTIESPANNNILNCNEAVILPATTTYEEDIYESSDTSSYSENSECTSDDLDCGLAMNGATNGLTFNTVNSGLSPFSLISTVPTTNDLINGPTSTSLIYDQTYQAPSTFIGDQSFRYYSSTLQTDPNLLMNQSTTTDHQLINNNPHLNHTPYYYSADTTSSMYNSNLATVDCYTTAADTQTDLLTKPMLTNDVQQIAVYNSQQPPVVSQQLLIETHYTDLSQSIASSKSTLELFATTSSTNHFDLVDCVDSIPQLDDSAVAVHSSGSDDSSSSRQSLNANLEDNLTSGESTQNDEDNFGEIIKNTIVAESVTA